MGSHEDGRRWVSSDVPSAVLFAQYVTKQQQIARTQRGAQPRDSMEVVSLCLNEILHVNYHDNVVRERRSGPILPLADRITDLIDLAR